VGRVAEARRRRESWVSIGEGGGPRWVGTRVGWEDRGEEESAVGSRDERWGRTAGAAWRGAFREPSLLSPHLPRPGAGG